MENLEKRIKETVLRLQNQKSHNNSYFKTLGYQITGPIYFGYVCWLIKNCLEKDITHIYFLSRDGINPYKVYKKLSKLLMIQIPQASYLYASRRAMLIPSISELTKESPELRFLISSWWEGLKVKEFLFRLKLNLSGEEANFLIKKIGFSSLEYKVKKTDYSRLEDLFIEASKIILARGKEEKQTLYKYIKQEGLLETPHPAIVDIGWGGSMQKSIFEILKKEKGESAKLDGFYVGTNNRIKKVRTHGSDASGFILSSYEEDLALYVIWQSTEILEFMFSASHPTVLFFKETKENIKPIFSVYNNELTYRKYAKELQNSAFQFINDLLNKLSIEDIGNYIKNSAIDSDFYFNNLFKLVLNPNKNDAKYLSLIRHLPGLGETFQGDHIIEYTKSYSPKILCYRFEHAYWENGFLATLSKVQKFILIIFCKKYRQRASLRKQILKSLNQKHPDWNI